MFAFIRVIVICSTLLMQGFVQGAEWSVKGAVDQNLSYDDNVRMRVDERKGSFKYMIVPTLTFQHKTDMSEISANATYGTQLYTDIEGFDQDIQHYDFKSMFKTEMLDWGVASTYSVTPTRNTAVEDSGVFDNNSTRNVWSVSPFVTYNIDEIDSISFSASHSERTFSNSGNTQGVVRNNFNDSQSTDFSLGWRRLWSERYLSSISFFYSRFESQQQASDGQAVGTFPLNFNSVGINFSNTYLLTENWKLSGTVGGRHTETESILSRLNSSSFGFLVDAGISYTGENYSGRLRVHRSLTPSNLGQLQEQTGANLKFSYQILENLSASFDVNYLESTSVNSTSSSGNFNSQGTRKNFMLSPSINWRIYPGWSIGGSYRYRLQEGRVNTVNSTASEADSNLFMLSINYNWQGLSLSR